MTDVATVSNGQAPVIAGAPNAFEAYGNQADKGSLPFLKFKDGEFLFGTNAEKITEGTQLLALVSDLMIGWQRWHGGAPTDERMGMVAQGYTPCPREDLGEMEKSKWEVDPEGRPRDPWQRSNKLPLVFDSEETPLDDGTTVAFVTGSAGGIGSIGRLCKEYGHHIRTNPDEFPVVELQADSYYNKKWDRNIKTPVLKVVGWTTMEAWAEATAGEAPAAAKPKAEPKAKPKAEPKTEQKAPKKRF